MRWDRVLPKDGFLKGQLRNPEVPEIKCFVGIQKIFIKNSLFYLNYFFYSYPTMCLEGPSKTRTNGWASDACHFTVVYSIIFCT